MLAIYLSRMVGLTLLKDMLFLQGCLGTAAPEKSLKHSTKNINR